ncbi:sugar efflux transporter for intercellular exchange-domain-containing protein [Fimicolochytrium jonesii]|uniref:sugar efflux transporter for intercellular exchange-domain-containing protein n=1 Tax=Fimicolochytrium jonesii TaxID=1396493 RepID=UPI0022FE924B|nr:sugar efflux transporter for intercellular exchange-domain-containing protein [Fimicolochytrium jonesii]KAI8824234.1 sugar efflux transporter for intercellular exchange-domain-containing protein [Fimicolochytrium jonesii]
MPCSSDACHIVLDYAIPSIGVLTTLAIAISPYKAVRRVVKAKCLEDVDPIPFSILAVNALAWAIYGLLIQDYFVATPNILSIPIALLFTMLTLLYSPASTQNRMMAIVTAGYAIVFMLAMVAFIALHNKYYVADKLLGSTSIATVVLFYGSPLAGMWRIVKERNARSINAPLAITCFVNGSLWTAYGLAVGNAFIWAPNATGAVFSAIQLTLIVLFRASRTETLTGVIRKAGPFAYGAQSVSTVVRYDGRLGGKECLNATNNSTLQQTAPSHQCHHLPQSLTADPPTNLVPLHTKLRATMAQAAADILALTLPFEVLRKADEFQRLAQSRRVKLGKGEAALPYLCLELACQTADEQSFPARAAQAHLKLPPKQYATALTNLRKALNIAPPQVSLESLAIKVGATHIVPVVKDMRLAFETNYGATLSAADLRNVDWNHPDLTVALFYMCCKAVGMKFGKGEAEQMANNLKEFTNYIKAVEQHCKAELEALRTENEKQKNSQTPSRKRKKAGNDATAPEEGGVAASSTGNPQTLSEKASSAPTPSKLGTPRRRGLVLESKTKTYVGQKLRVSFFTQ